MNKKCIVSDEQKMYCKIEHRSVIQNIFGLNLITHGGKLSYFSLLLDDQVGK
jgi:hypothetical protein